MSETWKTIKGYEGLYVVSTLGRVKSLARRVKRLNQGDKPVNERLLKLGKKSNGYLVCVLANKGVLKTFAIHRLVLENFSPQRNIGCVANHKNGIKTDNRLCNLEWVTQKENVRHGYDIGLNHCRRRVVCIDNGRKFDSLRSAAIAVNGDPRGVFAVCSGRIKTYRGLKFGYLKEEKDGNAKGCRKSN